MMKTHRWMLGGGIDLVRPPINRHKAPGELIGCMNYESRDEGYRRIQGYERFDGRKAPSNIFDDDPGEEDKQAEIRRAAIGPVPGDNLLAVWRYRDRTYAFARDGSETKMYGSSPNGWQQLPLGWRTTFTGGTGSLSPGDTIQTGGGRQAPRAKVLGFYLTSGAWDDDDAAGVIVLNYTSNGRFAANSKPFVKGQTTSKITIAAEPVQQSVGDGEAFRFVNHNFFGLGNHERMYGLSGSGKPFEFDGSMFLELDTGVTTTFPTRIAVHENHLYVGFTEGSIVYSGIGNPRSFDSETEGAGEVAIGDTLSELLPGYRGTLFAFGRNSTGYFTGVPGTANYAFVTVSNEAGAMPHTAVLMDEPTVLDDRGFRNVSTTEAFGDFSIATISKPIRPLLDYKRDGQALPVCSTRIRRKSQYRVWFSDGDCIVINYVRRRGHLSAEYTRFAYDLFEKLYDHEKPEDDYGRKVGVLTSVCSVEDSDGRERVFATMEGSMFVYELDQGKSFDSHPIPYFMRLAYNDFGNPALIKRYRKLLIEVDSTFFSTFAVSADFDDEAVEGERGRLHTIAGPTSFWSEGDWSAAYWDVVPTRKAEQRIHGRGRNISVMLYSHPTEVEEAHVVSGVTVYFEPRRLSK